MSPLFIPLLHEEKNEEFSTKGKAIFLYIFKGEHGQNGVLFLLSFLCFFSFNLINNYSDIFFLLSFLFSLIFLFVCFIPVVSGFLMVISFFFLFFILSCPIKNYHG